MSAPPLAHKIIPRRTEYVDADHTDIRKTFDRVIEARKHEQQVVQHWHKVTRIK
jgi:hypothetical protein